MHGGETPLATESVMSVWHSDINGKSTELNPRCCTVAIISLATSPEDWEDTLWGESEVWTSEISTSLTVEVLEHWTLSAPVQIYWFCIEQILFFFCCCCTFVTDKLTVWSIVNVGSQEHCSGGLRLSLSFALGHAVESTALRHFTDYEVNTERYPWCCVNACARLWLPLVASTLRSRLVCFMTTTKKVLCHQFRILLRPHGC